MKLIIVGATGFVAQELIRQCLPNPDIMSIVAVARRPIPNPVGANADKVKSVLVADFDNYSEEVKKEFAGADACIWTVAVTPTKAKEMPFEEVRRVCHTSTLVGLRALHDAGLARSFRFIYMSGFAAERDQSKKPHMMASYILMRGETENAVLAFAAEHSDEGFEVCVVKPGAITHDAESLEKAKQLRVTMGIDIPNIDVEEISAAMLQQVVHGIEKEPLMNDDLAIIGRKVLERKV
ncbi:putative nucleoside-diphosphate-sugar epimerase [Mycena sanguinolenta]|uniref:Putative nucleoside-diphosphate-sugar epimerase n=1 Tax=Mycena sanguinolenta TaxID=230812 RepID=A0A8H7DKK2_9AGAR|nr:putative nucleoside-diphosphate-sugar epimerase [Mycena sanguinolenta]